jgi:hypothetical protein
MSGAEKEIYVFSIMSFFYLYGTVKNRQKMAATYTDFGELMHRNRSYE